MSAMKIGDFIVHKIVDHHTKVPMDMVFVDHDWEVFEENASWLAPGQIDMANRMPYLSFHSWVVQTGQNNILIDSCIGNHKDRGGLGLFHMMETDYLENLGKIGLSVDDIDYVMCTHMHADHVGWNTRLVDNIWQPTFPNAMYVFAEKEYRHWEKEAKANPDGKWQERSYYDSVLPVMDAGQVCLVETDFSLEDGVWLEGMPGHSPGNCVIHAQSGDRKGIFSGDVMHHAVQAVNPLWYTNFCFDKPLSAASRKKFVEQYADKDVLILPAHFSGSSAGHIRSNGDKLIFDFA